MAGCEYTLDLRALGFEHETERTFNSDRKLDEFLWENRGQLLAAQDGIPFFDLNPLDEQIERLKDMKRVGSSFAEATRPEKAGKSLMFMKDISDLAVGIGFSRLYGLAGSFENMEIPVKPNLSTTSEERETEEKQNSLAINLGTDGHALIESRTTHKQPTGLKLIKPGTHLYDSMNAAINLAMDTIIQRHTVNGVKPKIASEVEVVPKSVDKNWLDIIRSLNAVTSGNVGSITQARPWGRADLIVIDANGDAWIYDFKFTENPIIVGTQHNAINEMNLASYGAVAKQYDLNVKGLAFVNFGVKYNADKTSVDSVKFNKDGGILILGEGNKNVRTANTYYPSTIKSAVKTINDVQEIMDNTIPQSTIMNQRKGLELSVEQEMGRKKPISSNPSLQQKHPNAKYCYYVPTTSKPSGLNPAWFSGNWLLASSEEEMKERLTAYIEKYNAQPQDILLKVANAVENSIAHNSTSELSDSMKDLAFYASEQLSRQFKPYIVNHWTLIHDETLLQNGYFLFQKPNSNIIDVVMVDTHKLNVPVRFNSKYDDSKYKDPRRTTILGEFLRDSEVDPMFFMRGDVGNAILIKAMAWLTNHADTLGDNIVRSVKAISVSDEHVYECTNLELTTTWSRLVSEYNKKHPDKPIQDRTTGLLMDDVRRAIEEANDILQNSKNEEVSRIMSSSAFKTLRPDGAYTIDDLIERYKRIAGTRKWDSSRVSPEDELAMVRLALLRGALSYYGTQAKSESNVGAFVNHAMALEGTDAASMKESQSIILRQQSEITTNFYDVYKAEFVKRATKFQIAYKAFRKAAGLSPILGDDFKYFQDHWFIKDGDKIHESLSLKREDDPYWNTCSKEELTIRDLYFENWNRLRYNDNLEEIQKAKNDGTYYEIPLITANFREQLSKSGIWDSVKGWFARFKERSIGHLFDLDENIYETEAENDIETAKLPSYIQDMYRVDKNGETVREKSIAKNGIGKYETNMEIVMLTVLAVGLKREYSEHAMMLTTAMRAIGYYNQIVNKHDMHNILEALDKIIKSKLYNRSVIDKENRGIAAVINFAKGFTSIGTIALKWESFARETLKGILDGFARTKFDEMYGGKFGTKDYMWALKELFTSAGGNIDVTSFMMQLSHSYGMANFTGQQIVEASKTNPYSLYQIGSDALFITATWPDFIHRTAMLLAHLKHIGAYDAYSLGEDGILTYDMTKDQRFQTWLKYRGKESEIPESEMQKWIEEHELYVQLLKDFENAGDFKDVAKRIPYKEGDLLPRALSPRLQDNLKTVADRLYGNYDKETKSLMQEQLLGALFFQFKTFPLERLSWWFKSPTHINDIEYVQQYWDDGTKIVQYIGDDRRFHFGHYEDVDPQWFVSGRAWYYKCPNGHEVFGHINRFVCGASYVLNHNSEEFKHTWETNPYFRGQMALALYDTLFGVLLAFLIQALMGEETITTMKDQEWYARWLYTVGTGMMQDGPVWGLIDGIIGDGAPPSLSILRNYLTSATSVITGDTSFIYAFASSLGATKNFTSLLTEQ